MKNSPILLIFFFAVLMSSCKKDVDEISIETISSSPNILLIIADDMGKDATAGFSEGAIKPNTPNIDAIKNNGISFNNFWVNPTCSPSRASIITGKYGYRTGVKLANDILDDSETLLHDHIKQQSNNAYATALIGKWHLSGNGTNISDLESRGIDHYAGLFSGGVQSYYQWLLAEDGQQTIQTEYITEKFSDLSIDWVNAQDKPWFLWLAYTAPHTPFHAPPSHMHSQGGLPEYVQGMDEMPYFIAAIEAMDFQIGRILDDIPENERNNTVVIFIGDNGTPNQVAQFPYSSSKAKGSLYQGGINTPLFVSGPSVTRIGEEDDNLICSPDLFATISQIVGSSISEIHDSKSFLPLFAESGSIRNFQYSEKNDGTVDSWVISNGEFKLFSNDGGAQEMYDLGADPYEEINLLLGTLNSDQQTTKVELENELDEIRQ